MERRVGTNQPLEERVEAFRDLVYRAIIKASEKGAVLRLYDGTISLKWPPLVHTHSSERYYKLHLSCSVLGGTTAHYSWKGRTWRAVFANATADVQEWAGLPAPVEGGELAAPDVKPAKAPTRKRPPRKKPTDVAVPSAPLAQVIRLSDRRRRQA